MLWFLHICIGLLARYWRQLILRIFLIFFPNFPVPGSNVLSIVLAREREDKKARAVQNGHIKDLDPIVVTTHLPSIKIFFNTIQVCWAMYFHYKTEHLIWQKCDLISAWGVQSRRSSHWWNRPGIVFIYSTYSHTDANSLGNFEKYYSYANVIWNKNFIVDALLLV